jgi:hypothetical protein
MGNDKFSHLIPRLNLDNIELDENGRVNLGDVAVAAADMCCLSANCRSTRLQLIQGGISALVV